MLILGLETSCDDTAIAVYDSEQGLLAHSKFSQTDLHDQFGGVVPELASRDHSQKLVPLIRHTLSAANKTLTELEGIAYTSGPGLVGALLAGAAVGASLAYALNIPGIGVHHMEGHLLAPMLEDDKPSYPFLALLVSGGHTQLVAVRAIGEYDIVGESIDDAAGEAFDKTAKLLGLPYPGGPELAKLALQGDPMVYTFPRPMVRHPGLDFSFSGLKTFALNTWQKSAQTEADKANIARAFEDAVVDTLYIKCRRALEQTGLDSLVVAGGVSANTALRTKLAALMQARQGTVFYPSLEFCTDNAAMIAFAGCQRLMAGENDGLQVQVRPRWRLTSELGG